MNAILIGVLLAGGVVDAGSPPVYVIDVCVSVTAPSAPRSEQREKFLSEARVVTVPGRPVTVRVGGSSVFTEHGSVPALAHSGIDVEAVVQPVSDGSLLLELRVVRHPHEQSEEEWRAVSFTRAGESSRFRPTIEVGDVVPGIGVTVRERRAPK